MSTVVTGSYFAHQDNLLQNVTDILTKCGNYFTSKCDSSFITKCNKKSFQNASGFLLQHTTVVVKYENFITKCEVYLKMYCYTANSCCNTLSKCKQT